VTRTLLAALSLFVALATAPACTPEPPPPAEPTAPSSLLIDSETLANAHRRAATEALRRDNIERGWRCGYGEAWEAALVDARDKAPLRWRSTTFGAVLTVGLVAFAIGIVGLLLLALVLPRLRPRSVVDDDEEPKHGFVAFVKATFTRFLNGLARLLRVEVFDRHAADQRLTAIHEARDARRLLTATRASVTALAVEGSTRAAELVEAIDDWRADLAVLTERLEAHGPWAARVEVAPLVARLVKTRRTAQQLRLECTRAELTAKLEPAQREPGPDDAEPPDDEDVPAEDEVAARKTVAKGPRPDDTTWATWRQLVDGRPTLPVDRAKDARRGPLPSWVRPTGWAGIAALALAVPMSAAWTAAGAFPLFFVLLFSLGGLGATFAARIWLFQHGRRPLLPGLADRIARTLTWVALLTTLLVGASSMTATESGLDLGDPPPVELPAERVTPPLPPMLGTVPSGPEASKPPAEKAPAAP